MPSLPGGPRGSCRRHLVSGLPSAHEQDLVVEDRSAPGVAHGHSDIGSRVSASTAAACSGADCPSATAAGAEHFPEAAPAPSGVGSSSGVAWPLLPAPCRPHVQHDGGCRNGAAHPQPWAETPTRSPCASDGGRLSDEPVDALPSRQVGTPDGSARTPSPRPRPPNHHRYRWQEHPAPASWRRPP